MKIKKIKFLTFFAFIAMALTGCLSDPFEDDNDKNDDSDKESEEHDKSSYVPLLDSTRVIYIDWSDTISVKQLIDSDSVSIVVNNNDVIVNSVCNDTIEYVLSGKTDNGMIKIYSEKDFNLVFNQVEIKNKRGPAMNIQSKKRAYMYVFGKSKNILEDAASYELPENPLEDQKSAMFAEGKIIISGDSLAYLTVTSNSTHAICSDAYVNISSGNIILNSVTDGIHANDEVSFDGGNILINASSDGVECEAGKIVVNDGTLKIVCGDKGLTTSYRGSSSKINPDVIVNGGNIDITVTHENGKGVRSIGNYTMNGGKIKVFADKLENEGIESKKVLEIYDGEVYVESYDNGLNSGNDLNIYGGKIYSCSFGNDGIDSNGKIIISGGIITSIGAGELESGFDCGNNIMKVTGGTFIGIGTATSKPNLNVSTQPSIIVNSNLKKNQLVNLSTANGDNLITFKVPNVINSTVTLISSPKIKLDTEIKVYLDGSIDGGEDVNGIVQDGNYKVGNLYGTTTVSSMTTEM